MVAGRDCSLHEANDLADLSKKSPRIVACPRCGAPVPWVDESRFRPFCSAHCKRDDLGAWASGQYRIAAKEEEPFSDEADFG
jgi:endogenous inhibitor of DNA gyrase (YacG/DUF329 family)